MRIVDTHLHLIYPDHFSYPWLDRVPALKRKWDWSNYWTEAKDLGIEAAIHMEVAVAAEDVERETQYALKADPHVVAAVSGAMPEQRDFPGHLERIIDDRRIKGVRRLLQDEPDELSAAPHFRENVRRLAAPGLTFDLCVRANQLRVAYDLARSCPEVQFVLDHCGNPLIDSGELEDWRIEISRIAALPNVAGKISGIVNHAPQGWTGETLRPAVEHMISTFGWDRVVFGSDRPVLTVNGTLTSWVRALKAIVSGASTSEQERLFSRNAERIYRLLA